MKTIFIIFLFFPLIQRNSLGQTQTKAKSTSNKQIDISEFYDSSHHWYDITDSDKIILPQKNQKRYDPVQIKEIADNILLYQKSNGGWPKNYDMLAVLTPKQKEIITDARNDLNTTFDNGATYSQIKYLAKAYNETNDTRYEKASIKGLNFIFSAQYSNGGWSQFYPDTSGYRKYITFNDGAMVGIMNLLYNIVERKSYLSFVSNEIHTRAKVAFEKGIDCILKTQIVDNGRLTAWCQQHDNIDFHPQSARTFELASICNDESVGIVELLMRIENPDKRIINSIEHAVQWFEHSKIYETRVKIIKAPTTLYKYRTSSIDKIVVKDKNTQPIWARFYELKTERPLFSGRNGKAVYSLKDIERERRSGYRWYTYAPQEILNKYPEWEKKWIKD